MRIAITGTTSGLGAACKARFAEHDIREYNRPEYDLQRTVGAMVRRDWDVFINNAYSGWAQVDLLYKLFDLNKDRQCTIINISSVCADKLYDYAYPYSVHKKALDLACQQLQQIDSKCRVINVKLGRLDTPMVAHRSGPKMDPSEIADEIARIIDRGHGPMLIKEIVFDNYYGD